MSPKPIAAAPVDTQNYNPMQRIGFYALLGFLYFYNSRVADVTGIYALHLPLVLGALAGLSALMSGGLVKVFQKRTGICYIALTVWFILGVPSSFWRGGSVGVLESWLRTILVWAFLIGLPATHRECKAVLNVLVCAAATAALLGSRGSMAETGRLSLDAGRFDNPNYLALSLLIALPFVWRLYAGPGPGMFRRIAAAGTGLLITLSIFRTGSRAALYAMVIMLLIAFLRASVAKKIPMLLGAALLLVASFSLMPGYLRERYFTFASADSAYDSGFDAGMASAAAASTQQREHLFRESITITLQHPVFGVGIGNFSPYVFQWNKDRGVKKEAYLGTHNTYTQMSSEAGLPALLLFIAVLVMCFRALARVIRAGRNDGRPEVRDIRITALATQLTLIVFCLSLFSIHVAYDILTHMVTGIALMVAYTSERELKRLGPPRSQPEPAAVAEGAFYRRQLAVSGSAAR